MANVLLPSAPRPFSPALEPQPSPQVEERRGWGTKWRVQRTVAHPCQVCYMHRVRILLYRQEIKLRGEFCHPWSVMELGLHPAL